ncbi:MAG: pyruvate, phosphate dikinase [Euryarchaeota archaeon]|nr:pyruvate, phosphate dikinase [Euryarchaeota archaeon]
MATRYVFLFSEGDGKNKQLLGGKGAGLCTMTQLGLPVPPGFVISTEACLDYFEQGEQFPPELMPQVRAAIASVEKAQGRGFGDPPNPLLLSVRSGSAVSMPGMMDTILNLGLNDDTVSGLAARSGDERFAWDSYRRFISLFSSIALGIDGDHFHRALETLKRDRKARFDTDLSTEDLRNLVNIYKLIVRGNFGKPVPSDPYEQLALAVRAVFASWNGKRCVDYRREFKITSEMANGTAANVQAMVFGNLGPRSATGVAFTRDPGTGENAFFGDYLTRAQGEDIVAGIRTPKPISELRTEMPEVFQELLGVREKLEKYFHEVQDIEFTVEEGRLYMLQTRNAKMNAAAAVKTSVDLMRDGVLSKEDAILRLNPSQLSQLMYRQIDPRFKIVPIAAGIGASPGAASGSVVFDADEAERQSRAGRKVILLREQTKPEDVHGFFAAQGILTAVGGKTSHAAVVARSIGKPCVSGCGDIRINHLEKSASIGEHKIEEGTVLTIDGTAGRVWLGEVPTREPDMSEELNMVLRWSDGFRTLAVMTNADTPADALRARKFGAQGIGLCRTERMFNAADRLPVFQELILAEGKEERQRLLERLVPLQKQDFKAIFRAMEGLPVTVRLLDPPLHEFLPSEDEVERDIENLKRFQSALENINQLPDILKAVDPHLGSVITMDTVMVKNLEKLQRFGLDKKAAQRKAEVLRKVRAMKEVNPMLGHRGVRLGITYPDIYEMQVEAILEAAGELIKERVDVHVEIMVPQVCTGQELKYVQGMIKRIEKRVSERLEVAIPYKFGTMIEVVRACMRAGRLAEMAEFFSFGTNDLTQATFSFSREDAENKFLPLYNERRILQDNPFEILDVKGVGRLMMITVEWGRKTRPDLKVGICGEHGGEPAAVEFCHSINLDYVSCSPYRVPIARLAAGQAAIKAKRGILNPPK